MKDFPPKHPGNESPQIPAGTPRLAGYPGRLLGSGAATPVDRAQAATPVDRAPEIVSVTASLINRSQEHNEALRRLIDRTQNIADRMFGGQPPSKDDRGQDGGPSNALGALETSLMVGEMLACRLLAEIQRLEVL